MRHGLLPEVRVRQRFYKPGCPESRYRCRFTEQTVNYSTVRRVESNIHRVALYLIESVHMRWHRLLDTFDRINEVTVQVRKPLFGRLRL